MAILIVPTEYPTIQAAVNAAQANDTVSVLPGNYFENVIIAKDSINIKGQLIGANLQGTSKENIGIIVIGNNITIENIKLNNYTIGISINGNNNNVFYCTSIENDLFGIVLIGNNCNISRNGFDKNGLFGANLNGNNNEFNNNRCLMNTTGGVTNSFAPLTNSKIMNSNLVNPQQSVSSPTNGLSFTIQTSNNNLVKNNIFDSTNGVSLISQNNIIEDNDFISCSSTGISILGINNNVINNSISSSKVGISIKTNEVNIYNNSIRSCSESGILIIGTKSTCMGNLISNSCIGIQNIGNNMICKNKFFNVGKEIFES